MKTYIAIFSLLLCIPLFAQKDWKLKKDKNDIKIYVKSSNSSSLKIFKAEMTVQSSIDEVLDVIVDGDKLQDWNYKALDSKLLSKTSESEYLIWLALDLPWPVRNRDVVIALKIRRITQDVVKIDVSAASDRYEEKDDYLRITYFEGYWLLEQMGDTVKITHQMHGDPGGSIPNWFVNSTITKAPFYNLNALKERVE
ncbi:START domain-containing protein [uncultured Kordia sp.]|uniref:START domain-containing protein n=1 Tax=uncultured Kordia sp. TaxID=507699 RepID=UPI002630B8D6|nr:START domain-containing protein [uncultured Kordia sp.]